MAECERLLRAAGELSAESKEIKETLHAAVEEDAEPSPHAAGRRQAGSAARARSRARSKPKRSSTCRRGRFDDPCAHRRAATRGKAARRCGRTGRRAGKRRPAWDWRAASRNAASARTIRSPGRCSTLLAAAETNEAKVRGVNPEAAAALAALAGRARRSRHRSRRHRRRRSPERRTMAALSCRATVPSSRGALRRTLDADAVDRITAALSRDTRFRDAANVYIGEFESLLARGARRRWRRAAGLDDSQRRHGQDLSHDRLCAGTVVVRSHRYGLRGTHEVNGMLRRGRHCLDPLVRLFGTSRPSGSVLTLSARRTAHIGAILARRHQHHARGPPMAGGVVFACAIRAALVPR